MMSIAAYRGKRKAYVSAESGTYYLPRLMVSRKNQVSHLGLATVHLISRLEKQRRQRSLPVAFMPGFACNLACEYCYQRTDPTHRSAKPVLSKGGPSYEDIAKFVSSVAAAHRVSNVNLSLLGGEPLMYRRQIREFVGALRDQTDISDISLVTNGTLLKEENLTELMALGLSFAQVTFDGSRAFHDHFRSFKSGTGTYDAIMKNLVNLAASHVKLEIRINLSAANILDCGELIDDLAQCVSPEQVGVCLTLIDDTKFYSEPAQKGDVFFSQYRNLVSYTSGKGFLVSLPGHSGLCRTCGNADVPGGLVVTADGKLYSCWDSAGQLGFEVGDVQNSFASDRHNHWVRCGYGSPDGAALHQRLALEAIKAIEGENETL
ncbi:radical SAM protein [Ancrocorticia populi]|uniref:Radical SAM core domain-containing protein n=1 Tax=Ancrocorticia populi TaxID=2175228 RepID=A0A2V1KFD8_9ACTO|nr:radical SAM protein [Ancrocorticia populi]PWF27544.1 hypothetical protein DD236_03980 [Ancrocorticia populi]